MAHIIKYICCSYMVHDLLCHTRSCANMIKYFLNPIPFFAIRSFSLPLMHSLHFHFIFRSRSSSLHKWHKACSIHNLHIYISIIFSKYRSYYSSISFTVGFVMANMHMTIVYMNYKNTLSFYQPVMWKKITAQHTTSESW